MRRLPTFRFEPRRDRAVALAAGLLALALGAGARASYPGTHEGDLVVGQTAGGQLAVVNIPGLPVLLTPVSGILAGWTAADPGFDSLKVDQPDDGILALGGNPWVFLEVVAIDPGLRIWQAGLRALADAPGERIELGGADLHTHPIWQIELAHPAIGSEWEGTLTVTVKLVDRTGALSDSLPFRLSFTNQPPVPELWIRAITLAPEGGLRLEWDALDGAYSYTVEAGDTLTPGTWAPVPPVGQWPIGAASWTDPSGLAPHTRLYRVLATAGPR